MKNGMDSDIYYKSSVQRVSRRQTAAGTVQGSFSSIEMTKH